jgi:3-methyladenine DNA glycosylase AlkC
MQSSFSKVKFKEYYNGEFAKLLGDKIASVYNDFPVEQFVEYVTVHVAGKEFTERQDVIVDALEKTLPSDYGKCIALFMKILGPELKQETGMFSEGWRLWPIGRYVERHGVENIALSLEFIAELTKRFTGEYAIRPLLRENPAPVLDTLEKWSKDGNVQLRRLASESIRLRLPWAKKITVFIDEFERCKGILSNLRHDKSKFVQKSVGNNINDLYKDCPEKASEIINEWQSANPTKETGWIISHGMRSLKKQPKT